MAMQFVGQESALSSKRHFTDDQNRKGGGLKPELKFSFLIFI